jgi:hypothetical protein
MMQTKKKLQKNISFAIKNCDFETESVEKYRLEKFFSTMNLIKIEEARNEVLGKPLTKKIVVDFWNKVYGIDKLFGDCTLCGTKESVNCVFPNIFTIAETKIFVCKNCYSNVLLKGLKKQRICNIVESNRLNVWIKSNGLRKISICFCCNEKEIDFTDSIWHVGHVEAKCNGGSNDLANLKSICLSCNLDMKSENMLKYMQEKNFHITKLNDYNEIIIKKMINLLQL